VDAEVERTGEAASALSHKRDHDRESTGAEAENGVE
jgi:hypothetical protein